MRTFLKVLTAVSLIFLVTAPNSTRADQDQDPILDSDVHVINFEEMKYPAIGRTAQIDSFVVVQATLDDDGKVSDAAAISGSKFLIPDCLTNIRTWRFSPNARHAAIVVYRFQLVE